MQNVFSSRFYLLMISLLVSAAVVSVQQFPNWYAAQQVPEGKVYMGQASWFDP